MKSPASLIKKAWKVLPVRFISAILLPTFVSGCAQNTLVKDVGNNTYVMQKRSRTAAATGQEMLNILFQEAKGFCLGKGMQMHTVSTSSNDGILFIDFARGTLEFKCISSGKAD